MSTRATRRRPAFSETIMASGTTPLSTGFPETRCFVQAEFFARQSGRKINRVVIHITSGNQLSSTFYWFRHPRRPIRTVRANGSVVGKIFAPVFLRRANELAAGRTPANPIYFAPTGDRRHTGLFDTAIHTLGPIEQEPVPVSAHYVVDRDGAVYQFVDEANIAWHAGTANSDSIGIEHICSPNSNPTERQYQASARLTSYLCDKYDIPKERSNIIGHQEADRGTDHNCPGQSWNWTGYMALVNQPSTDPNQALLHVIDQAFDQMRQKLQRINGTF